MTAEEIYNDRKNKFLRIGRTEGFMSNLDEISSLKPLENKFDLILFFQISEDFSAAAHHQKYSDQIKTKINEKYIRRKMLNFLYFRHNLRNPEKHPYSGNQQQNAPDQLQS